MPQDTKDLLIKPVSSGTVSGETLLVMPESTGYQYLTLSIRKLLRGEKFQSETAATELGLVVLGGRCSVESTAGSWSDIGSRAHVFDGLPSAVYLPIETGFTISAETDCELALCLSRAEVRFPGRLVTPDDVEIEVRGGENATRQINHILNYSSRSILRAGIGPAIHLTNTTYITHLMRSILKSFIITRWTDLKGMRFRESIQPMGAWTKRSPCATVNWYWFQKGITR